MKPLRGGGGCLFIQTRGKVIKSAERDGSLTTSVQGRDFTVRLRQFVNNKQQTDDGEQSGAEQEKKALIDVYFSLA